MLVLGISVFCCHKDPPPMLEMLPDTITLSSIGEPSTIEVKSNLAWKLSGSLPDWLTLSAVSGEGNMQIQVRAIPNTQYPRVADLLFVPVKSEVNINVHIKLTQDLLHFESTPADVLFESDGGSVTAMLETEAAWSVQNAPEWVIISPRSGKGMSSVVISASPNLSKKERSGSISFIYYDGALLVPLTQNGDQTCNTPPDTPKLISPANHSIDVSTCPLFEWSCFDPDGDPLTYTIAISEDGEDFTEYGPYTDAKVYLDYDLATSKLYYYKIKADDNDKGQTWSEVYGFTTIDRSIYADKEMIAYMHSSKPKPVILVFTGDGYVKQDCIAGGLFEQNAVEGVEALFSVEPFKTYREYFSIYIMFAHSLESGATQKDQNIVKKTVFSTAYEDASTSMTINYDKVFEYAEKVPGMKEYGLDNTSVIVMVNQDRYAGTCWMWASGKSVAICPVSRRGEGYDYAAVVRHEGGGHGFGRLADEYINYNSQITTSKVLENRTLQKEGMYLNVDFINDPQRVLWSHFIGLTEYGRVGVYEGAALYRYGAWRSEETNCMINNIKYYNAPCRELIVKRILTISGEGYSLGKFMETDYEKAPNAAVELETKSYDSHTFTPLAPPVVMW